MTTLTDAELIDRMARTLAYSQWRGRLYDRCLKDPGWEGRFHIVETYQSSARELLASAGIITPAGRAEIERREGEG